MEFLSLMGGCIGLSESTPVKRPHCRISLVIVQIIWLKKFLLKLPYMRTNDNQTSLTCIFIGDLMGQSDKPYLLGDQLQSDKPYLIGDQ